VSDFTIIFNPQAGKGTAHRVLALAEKLLRHRSVPHEIQVTERAGHATELAKRAPGPYVVAVGGDGTINEVGNGLVGTGKILGIIPGGCGNDLIKSLNLPRRTADAFEVLLRGRKKEIDFGTVRCENPGPGTGGETVTEQRCFFNGVGAGFDAEVAVRTREFKHLSGTLLYLAAVFKTLGKYASPEYEVTVDGKTTTARNLLMAIGNGTCAGGGFYLTPEARVDDGLLDLCIVSHLSIPRILMVLPLAMRGKHGKAREVTFFRGKKIGIRCSSSFYVHADGEIVGRGTHDLAVQLSEERLPVLVSA
jgi:diacylglycerol kinase (ATP)